MQQGFGLTLFVLALFVLAIVANASSRYNRFGCVLVNLVFSCLYEVIYVYNI